MHMGYKGPSPLDRVLRQRSKARHRDKHLLANEMLLDLDEMVQDHERTIEAQQQKIKEQAKEIDDLNTTIARLRHQYKHTCQTVREITR